jgi:NADPH-dependent glutamate synthase beta subunit-like oxidoreductase
LFKTPHKLDFARLVPVETLTDSGAAMLRLPPDHWRERRGFELTDAGMDLVGALDQAHYCIKCHNQAKDSCSTELREKTSEFRKSPLGVTLAGCPLSEKISEMNVVRERGNPVGALAIVAVDNPMAAVTGHRICNECMKACVFQKQDPVDIRKSKPKR